MRDIKFGKFEVFAVYLCQQKLLEGYDPAEAKQFGFAIACLGAQAKMGVRRGGGSGSKPSTKDVVAMASKKKKTTITPECYDKLILRKFGRYASVFEDDLRMLVEAGLSYDDVKSLVAIPARLGAKITWEHWRARLADFTQRKAA